jgi:predicted anti-sigma-YlaC factor YlaD
VIHGHKYFEMQAALSATGHLTGSELLELEQHVSQCPSCRIYMLDMAAMSRELFLMQDDRWRSKTPPGMHDRFLQKAAAAGIAFRSEVASSTSLDLRFAGALAITVFLAALISFGWNCVSMSRVERAAVKHPSAMGAVTKDALGRTTQQHSGLFIPHQ